MKILKGLGVALAVLFGAYVLYNATLDGHYEVSRKTVMNAKPETVSAIVSEFRNWPQWSIWFERDSTMVATFGEKTSGVGAHYSWVSTTQGNGSMTILEYSPGERMKSEIVFEGQGTSNGHWSFTPVEGGCEVSWGFSGEMPFMMRWMTASMEKWVAPDFEQGLANLKELAESVQNEKNELMRAQNMTQELIQSQLQK